ncbi:CDP-glycerol glycerophosphotransferase family protein [Nocardioides sp.]|uniref:CDP-glycerol glycerophosphotransferase family protein n=1 Tax=Nocardioides sp. TaxID=35761 RepID=UPI002BC58411|nr:CDP-glycerol glycerophosphotransferase family protein [Nocardioides sp.]HSX67383.1 CDP-glycerol glycerophosphotransferase family protein [Nocardioides sp.]
MNSIERLAFDVDGHNLLVRYSMSRAVEMTALVVGLGDEGQRFPVVASTAGDYMYESIVDLREVVAQWPAETGRMSLGIESVRADGEVVRHKLGQARITERPWRLLSTEVDGVHVRLHVGPLGFTMLGVTADPTTARLETETLAFHPQGSSFEIKMRVDSDDELIDAEMVLTERRSGESVRVPLRVTRDESATSAQHGRRLVHLVEGRVDMATVTEQLPRESEYVPIHVALLLADGEERRRELRLPEGVPASARSLRPMTVIGTDQTSHYVPYLTFKGQRISLKVDHFEPHAFEAMRRLLRWAWLMPLLRLWKGVWLVGELPDRAQDNGYHFFRWVREQHPGKRVYYVITADSPHRDRLDQLGNVVVRGSIEHVRYALLATRLVSTHLPEYLLPTPDPRLVRYANGVRVFLQHGIMGMKNMVANYGRRISDFQCDIFHVTSAREREMIINDFGYLPSQVRVTGLPRFDSLLAPSAGEPRGLLIIPTWREWLLRPEFFVESEFLERWRGLLHDERIKRLVDAGEPVTFMLHPNLAHHTALFDAPDGVTVLRQGERDVQDLMREHRAMVTDYSSVGFDFALQGRPVYYFQFDRDRFLGRHPSHLDPVADLPGYVAAHAEDVLAELERDWQAGFAMPAENARRIARVIAHADRDNCARVYASVADAGGLRGMATRMRTSQPAGRFYASFRKSGAFRPAMKALMAVARLTPRSNTIVFESGSGKQYAGNPRAIYEELVRRDSDLRTVWSTTSTFRPVDLGTRKVTPKTPRFYWTLGRARFWVSDQNLGLEVKPARRTFYLQSWHGTPLKRMQHDAISQTGRKEGYLERVTRQTGYWSALVSPSPYATECFRSAFRYDGEVLELGYPRNDVLAGEGIDARRAATRARLGVRTGTRLVLFAPTFRDNVRNGKKYAFRSGLDFPELAAQLPDDVVFLVRAHHVTGRMVRVPDELRERILDVTDYEDAQDLMAAADALITDYSSTMFDYALTGRPQLFFCPDLEEYSTQVRGFYLDFEAQAPGPILTSQEELVSALHDLDGIAGRYREKQDAFVAQYGPLDDGHVAARVVDDLLER